MSVAELTTIPKPADRGDWLRARHRSFNASDAGVLYECHPFRTLADVAADKLADEPVDDGGSAATDRGNRLEPVLLQKWGDDHGVSVYTPDVLYVCGQLMATLDGLIVGNDTDGVEAKSTRDEWDHLPRHVHYQCVAQCVAAGLDRVHVIALDGTMRFKNWTVEPTDAERDDLMERVAHFWSFIDMGMAPEGVQFTYDHVVTMHPADTGEVRDVDDDALDLLRSWNEARQRRLAAQDEENELRDRVAALFADASVLRYEGVDLASFKASKPVTRFDAKWLEQDSPQTYRAYLREYPGARTLRPLKGLA